jgi:hypothetical protein
MKNIKIYLREKQYNKIKEIAFRNNVTFSHVIRWCIDCYKDFETEKQKKAEAFDIYIKEMVRRAQEKDTPI